MVYLAQDLNNKLSAAGSSRNSFDHVQHHRCICHLEPEPRRRTPDERSSVQIGNSTTSSLSSEPEEVWEGGIVQGDVNVHEI